MTRARSAVIALLHLDRDAESSLRDQVYRGLRELIVARRIAPGTLLPSTRAFAEELGVSRNTVVAAFDQLIAEGYVRTRSGAGSYVNEQLPDDLVHAPVLPRLEAKALHNGVTSTDKRAPRAFSLGIPAIEEFPYDVWRRLVTKRWRRPGSLARYGATAGLTSLREAIAQHVSSARGARCDAEQVFVVSGAHQAFDLAARVMLHRGDDVWVEDPGYIGAGRVFQAAGARLVPVLVDQEGIDVAAGVALSPRPRLIFVTPSHQFPLGVTMSMERRRALLEAANDADAWIIEDDYDCEFRYAGRPLPSLQGLDHEGRVIYVGSFSKVLMPGLRLAYAIVPSSLLELFHELRAVSGSHASIGDQAVVADFMREGHFARHIRRMRELYAERGERLVAAVRAEFGDTMRVEVPQAGTHVVGYFADGIDDRGVSAAALSRGVDALPLSRQYWGAPTRSGLMLGYAGVREPIIRRAVRALGEALLPFVSAECQVRPVHRPAS